MHLLYGSASGITTDGAPYFHQGDLIPGVPGSNEDEDGFGSDVPFTDVSGDGRADPAIAATDDNGFNGAVTALRSNGTEIVTGGARGGA